MRTLKYRMMTFEAVEKNLIRQCAISIGFQFMVFGIVYWLIGRDGSLIAPIWVCTIGTTAVSAFCEVFWRLVPSLRSHHRNKQAGGNRYRAKVEAALAELGVRRMLYQHWFVRKLDDVLNDEKL